MPTLSVKNIWPAAASQTFASFSALKSGFHKNPSPLSIFQLGLVGSGAPSVKTLTAIMIPNMKSAGIAILQSFSIPPDMPL